MPLPCSRRSGFGLSDAAGIATGFVISSRQQIPQDRQDHDQQHGEDRSAPEATHSKTSYSKSDALWIILLEPFIGKLWRLKGGTVFFGLLLISAGAGAGAYCWVTRKQ